jgi:hypothetical protein
VVAHELPGDLLEMSIYSIYILSPATALTMGSVDLRQKCLPVRMIGFMRYFGFSVSR